MKWYRLDNAAKLFPSVANAKNTSVFRISAVLTEPVNKDILQKAVEHLMDRYCMLFVQLRRGVFWNYFDTNHKKFIVEEETFDPCRRIQSPTNNSYLLRVLYYHNRISVEMFHSLADGAGTVEFLKSLLYYYFTFSGRTIDPEGKVLLVDDGMQNLDGEDGFSRIYDDKNVGRQSIRRQNAYQIRGTRFEIYGINVVSGVISSSALRNLAKARNATVTAYLIALLAYSISRTQAGYDRQRRRPIVIAVPVNLRKTFGSRTIRNFFGVVNTEIPFSECGDFEKVLELVKHQLTEKTQKDYLTQVIAGNLKFERNLLAKPVPLFIKNIFIGLGYKLWGERVKTITVSNIGIVDLPKDMASKVNQFEALLYPSQKSPLNCGITSTGDKMVISFTRTIEETDIIQHFFSYLSSHDGLDVTVYSNDWGMQDHEE